MRWHGGGGEGGRERGGEGEGRGRGGGGRRKREKNRLMEERASDREKERASDRNCLSCEYLVLADIRAEGMAGLQDRQCCCSNCARRGSQVLLTCTQKTSSHGLRDDT